MAGPTIQSVGSFSIGRKTAAIGTAFAVMVPPYSNQNTGVGTGKPGPGIPHITTLIIDAGSTLHTLTIMRPFNFTTFTADANAAQAVVNIAADPGNYASNFKYPLPNGMTAPSTANNLIAANDYVVYQSAAGQYVMDTVSSVSSLAITMTTNLPTGGVKQGGLFWFFGVAADTDPNTNLANTQFDTVISSRNNLTDPNGLWCALHAGDPLLVYNPNSTAADTLQLLAGYYAKH